MGLSAGVSLPETDASSVPQAGPLGVGAQLVFPTQGDGADRIVDPVVGHKIATVIGLAGQGSRGPAVAQHFGLQFIQPGLEPGQRRHGMRMPMTFRYGIFAQRRGRYLWSPQGAELLGDKTLAVGSVVGTLAALASLFMAEG